MSMLLGGGGYVSQSPWFKKLAGPEFAIFEQTSQIPDKGEYACSTF